MRRVHFAALLVSLAIGSAGRVDAGILEPSSFSSLGAFPTTPGTYTFSTDTSSPTLTGPGTSITGVRSGNIAVFTFDSIHIDGMTFVGGTGQAALALLSKSDVAISGSGVIDIRGGAGLVIPDPNGSNGGSRGVGAGAGGVGGFYAGGPGDGPGGGGGGQEYGSGPVVGGGGGGGFGGRGGNGANANTPPLPDFAVAGVGGADYGDLSQALAGGSGGGGGGTTLTAYPYGGGGGGGGGALEISAFGDIAIIGQILAGGGEGGVGRSNSSQPSGGGGGGSGGGVILHGHSVTLSGLLDVRGGNGGASRDAAPFSGGGGGAGGLVFIDTINGFTGDMANILDSGGSGAGRASAGSPGQISISAVVPEPSGLILLAIGAFCLIGWSSRGKRWTR